MFKLMPVFSGGAAVATTPLKDVKAPPWRDFGQKKSRGQGYVCGPEEVDMVNAAIYLRRPLLVTGNPGTGKSSLAYAVAEELHLGPVLLWSVTTRSSLENALYYYDAIGRLQDANLAEKRDIGQYIRLGPLGTAFLPTEEPRVLLIDEIDKSDADLANDLLNIFEEGEFVIPELARLQDKAKKTEVQTWDPDGKARVGSRIGCSKFPIVIMTSNGEREFPPAFYRRCLRLEVKPPDEKRLQQILQSRLDLSAEKLGACAQLIEEFLKRQKQGDVLATDQLLNAAQLLLNGQPTPEPGILNRIFQKLQ